MKIFSLDCITKNTMKKDNFFNQNTPLVKRLFDVKSKEHILLMYLNPEFLKHLLTAVMELTRFSHFKLIIDTQLKCYWMYPHDEKKLNTLELDRRVDIAKMFYINAMTQDILEDIKKVYGLLYNKPLVYKTFVLQKKKVSQMKEKNIQTKVYELFNELYKAMRKTTNYLLVGLRQFKIAFNIYYPKHQNFIQHMINVRRCEMKITYVNPYYAKIILVSFRLLRVFLLKVFCPNKQRIFSKYVQNVFALENFSHTLVLTPVFYLVVHNRIYTFSDKKHRHALHYTVRGIDFKFDNVLDKFLELLTGYTLLVKCDIYDLLCMHCIHYLFYLCKKTIYPLFWLNSNSKIIIENHSRYMKNIQ